MSSEYSDSESDEHENLFVQFNAAAQEARNNIDYQHAAVGVSKLISECTGIPEELIRTEVIQSDNPTIRVCLPEEYDLQFDMHFSYIDDGFLITSINGDDTAQHELNSGIMVSLLVMCRKQYERGKVIADLQQKITALEAENAALEAENEELRYRPGGPGYEEARARFSSATTLLATMSIFE